ncbi:MAG: hypothetical protein NT175_05595 [Bacteroidetes bacterium]|nr:hypothetical protein [Bacteroidota bacterium]
MAQRPDKTPFIEPKDISGGTIVRSSVYEGNALWGYIDGGADIYLEYGFLRVFVQEIDWQGKVIKIDVFEMSDKEAALGIFSLHRNNCETIDSLPVQHCYNPYQLIILKGCYYISIIISKPQNQQIMVLLARIVTDKIPDDTIIFPDLLTNEPLKQHLPLLRFFRGKIGLMNGYPQFEELFGNYQGINIYVIPVKKGDTIIDIAYIIFSTPQDMQRFCEANEFLESEYGYFYSRTENGLTRKAKLFLPKAMLYMETNTVDSRFAGPYLRLFD